MDVIISKFLENVDLEEILFILLSDHGFCPVRSEVLVNCLLHKQGFLRGGVKGEIDIENGVAVAYEYGDMWLNLKERELYGKIKPEEYEEVLQKLRNLVI